MDVDGQLTFEDSPLSAKFNEALSFIEKGNFQQTFEIMEKIFEENPDFTGVVDTMKSIKFWQNRWTKVHQFPEGYERAEYLFNEWRSYNQFIVKSKIKYEQIIIYLKNLIFKSIIKNLIFSYHQSDVPNIDILLQIGEIFIGIEEYQKAIESLEYARMFKKKDVYLLSLLATAYYKANRINKAKVLFWEIFLYDPQKIDLSKTDVDFIHQIVENINKELNLSQSLLLEWIPIYGVLSNIFNVKREINQDELARLNQKVQELENEFYMKRFDDKKIIEPKLINHYFWLIDYYTLQNKNKDYIKIYLNKLKDINRSIYEKYLNFMETNSNEKVS